MLADASNRWSHLEQENPAGARPGPTRAPTWDPHLPRPCLDPAPAADAGHACFPAGATGSSRIVPPTTLASRTSVVLARRCATTPGQRQLSRLPRAGRALRACGSLGLLALLALAFSMPAEAGLVFTEDWESGTGSWTLTGSGSSWDCTRASSGSCSLRLDPPCCSATTAAERSVDIPLDSGTVVSFRFQGDSTSGDTDGEFQVVLSNGGQLGMILTEGVLPNNGVNFASSGYGNHWFTSWPSSNTWYEARFLINAVQNTAQAQLLNSAGTLLATSDTLGIPSTADNIVKLRVSGVSWSSTRTAHNYDRITIDSGTLTTPMAPQSPSASPGPGAGEISLSWQAPASNGGAPVTSYKVYRATSAGGTYAHVATVTTTSWKDTGLPNGVTRYYRVSAVNVVGEGPQSTAVSATTFSVPSAPQNPSASAGPGVGEISLSWQAPASNGGAPVTSYKIYRSTSSSGGYSYLASATTTSWKDTSLPEGATRYYRISAVNVVGEGSQGGSVSATTFRRPSAPTAFSVSLGPGGGDATLTWGPPSDTGGTAFQYRVYRSTAGAGPYQLITSTQATTFVDTDLPSHSVWYYRVNGVNLVGEGAPSSIESLVICCPPCSTQALPVAMAQHLEYLPTQWSRFSTAPAVGWQVVTTPSPRGTWGDAAGHVDPMRLWYTSVNLTQGNYQTGPLGESPHNGTATSPGLATSPFPRIYFSSKYQIEARDPANRDLMRVEISEGNGPWRLVCVVNPTTSPWGLPSESVCSNGTVPGAYPCPLDPAGNPAPAWETRSFELPTLGQSFRVRFHFDTVDGLHNDHLGWMVTDVRIAGDVSG